jgi:hypothetical protein
MSIVKFVIFAFPRSGSTYLCSRLENHPGILCHYELFHPDAIAPAAGFVDRVPEFGAVTPTTRDQDVRAFIDTIFEHDLGSRAVGFKIFLDHNEAAQDMILNDHSILKVLLRRSTVDAYVSMMIAEATGEFTSTSATPTTAKVAIKAGDLIAFDETVNLFFEHLETVLRRTEQPFVSLQYEDIVAADQALDPLFDALGIQRVEAASQAFTRRQNSEALEDKVTNLKDVIESMLRLYRKVRKDNP